MTGHPSSQRLAELDTAVDAARRDLLEHVRECAECRAKVLARDPSQLFSLLSLEAVPPEILDRLSRGLDERLDAAAPARRPLAAMLALAASLLLAGFLGSYLMNQPVPDSAELAARARATDGWVSSRPVRVERPAPLQGVELLSSPGAGKLVNLSVGETRVVMIFDETLKL